MFGDIGTEVVDGEERVVSGRRCIRVGIRATEMLGFPRKRVVQYIFPVNSDIPQ